MRCARILMLGAIGAAAGAALTACRSQSQAGNGAMAKPAAAAVALRPFTGDPKVAREGRVLFIQYNCYSCHGGLAGGAMGPNLRDTTWKYGGTDSAIYASIHDGRPLGMPVWGNTLTADQIRALVVYIKSLRTTAEPKFFFWASGADTASGATS